MKVLAAPGTKCPKEGKPREYIDEQTVFDAPETTYYKRLINDGSLMLASAAAAGTTAKQKSGGN